MTLPWVSRRRLGWPAGRELRRAGLISVDTNILVYAHRRDSAFHEPVTPHTHRPN